MILAQCTIPIKTVSEKNRRDHWAVKGIRTSGIRCLTRMATHGLLIDSRGILAQGRAICVRLERVAPSAGVDDDNLRVCLSACRDGMADALGLANDRDPRVRWEYSQDRGAPSEYAVRIQVETEAP